MTQDLIESIDGGIATLTMNRPNARNALSRDMMFALTKRCHASPLTRPCARWC